MMNHAKNENEKALQAECTDLLDWLIPNPNLPPDAIKMSQTFYDTALYMVENSALCVQKRIALVKLIEAKDAAVRALLTLKTEEN